MRDIAHFTLLGAWNFCIPINMVEFCFRIKLSYLEIVWSFQGLPWGNNLLSTVPDSPWIMRFSTLAGELLPPCMSPRDWPPSRFLCFFPWSCVSLQQMLWSVFSQILEGDPVKISRVFSWCAAFSSLILCPEKSSCLSLLGLLVPSPQPTGFWVPPLCAEAWKFSLVSQPGWLYLICFSLLRDHGPELSIV